MIKRFSGSLTESIAWLSAGTFITRIVSFGSQLILAFLLSKEDFGIYAAAISITAIGAAIADGGADTYLIQAGKRKSDEITSYALGFAVLFNLLITCVMTVIAFFAAYIYKDTRIAWLVGLIGLSFPLQTLATILKAKLSVESRFKQLALVNTVLAILKYVAIIAFAWMGWGPFSFVLPMPILAIIEGVWLYYLAKTKVWNRGLHIKQLKKIGQACGWIIVGQAATALIQNGDYLALGFLLPPGVLGVYYFSYELVAQIGPLFAQNVYRVLFPTLAKPMSDEERHRQVKQSLRMTMLIVTGMSMTIVIGIAPIAAMLGWDRRFPQVVSVVYALAFFFPLRMLTVMTRAAMMATGRFRSLAAVIALQGVGLLSVAALAGYFISQIAIVTLIIGIYLGFSSLILAVWSLSKLAIPTMKVLESSLIPWLAGIVAGVGTLWLGNFITKIFTMPLSHITSIAYVSILLLLFTFLFTLSLIVVPGYRNTFFSIFVKSSVRQPQSSV